MTRAWRFEDSPNVAVLTTTSIIKAGMPILHVSHDDDDGSWQFHTGEPVDSREAMVVALKQIVTLDPSVELLADLPYGWIATRDSQASEWKRSPHP